MSAVQTPDPITLSVLQNGLMQVCNEMDLAFVRSAFSPVIAEALDRSDGIYHRDSGELIAQGELGLPVFVGTMQFTVQAVIERVQRLKIALHPGDVFIVNDPYLGGTHLMDVKFVQPFFRAGKLWCWLANTGHWPDTGGMVPGGFSANATEVEQEGLRLPPVKLYKQGVLDDEILSIILSNIRIADQRIGDIKAQAAALAVGERRLTALLDKYGHKGPAEIPPKRVYIWKDVLRTASVLQVPLHPPPAHPFNPLLALRCCAVIDAEMSGVVEGVPSGLHMDPAYGRVRGQLFVRRAHHIGGHGIVEVADVGAL